MTDLVLRDVAPDLAERIQLLADMQGHSVHDVMLEVLDTGVRTCEVRLRKQLDQQEEAALKQAISALEEVPDDAGFGLIGRLAGETQAG